MTEEAFRAVLIDRPISYHPIFAHTLGGVQAAVFLSQLLYWSPRGHDADGWIYKTQIEWEVETGLSRREQEHARRQLKSAGVLEEKRAGNPARLYYQIHWSALMEVVGSGQSRMAESANQDCPNTPIKNGGKRQALHTENTTQNTTEEKQAKETLPDYMIDLQTIPNPAHPFIKTEAEMVAWMAGTGITPRKANETASYIKGNWPGPRKTWKDPFAVFRTLVVKVWATDSGRNGSRPSRASALPETSALEAGWGGNARTDSVPKSG